MRQLGKYRLLEPVATGGMAEVFRAQVPGAAGFVKEVALKLIRGDLGEDSDFVRKTSVVAAWWAVGAEKLCRSVAANVLQPLQMAAPSAQEIATVFFRDDRWGIKEAVGGLARFVWGLMSVWGKGDDERQGRQGSQR